MDRVLSIEGVEDLRGKTVFKGLFGDDLVIVSDEEVKPSVPVMTKLTPTEAAALDGWVYKFGISKCKFIRDCICQKMKDLTMITEP